MRAPYSEWACPRLLGQVTSLLLPAAWAVVLIACEDAKAPTAARGPGEPAAATSPTVGSADRSDLTAQAMLQLPINQTASSATVLFGLTQTGSGPNGRFVINNTGSTSPALSATTNGFGQAFSATSTGLRPAGTFAINNSSSLSPAVLATTNGGGPGILSTNSASGRGGEFHISSSANGSAALFSDTRGTGRAGEFQILNTGNANIALLASTTGGGSALEGFTTGTGRAGTFFISNSSNLSPALLVSTAGKGWAGQFFGLSGGKGVLIQTNGGAGLQVVGGSKQAVVATAGGARSLYTEESSEVWFTDYGFGRLEKGRARILLDPTFAQTINVEQAYHVFVQPYGDAELYVSNRNSLGFEVRLRGGDPGVEFSYRVVAKRRGFEAARLEPAPWADHAVAVAPMR